MPLAQPRLIPQPVEAVSFLLMADAAGTWQLTVTVAAPGTFIRTRTGEVYDELTLEEASDVMGATLDGVTHPGPT